jgi:hypothetical protein
MDIGATPASLAPLPSFLALRTSNERLRRPRAFEPPGLLDGPVEVRRGEAGLDAALLGVEALKLALG